jgi:hypothetical protein
MSGARSTPGPAVIAAFLGDVGSCATPSVHAGSELADFARRHRVAAWLFEKAAAGSPLRGDLREARRLATAEYLRHEAFVAPLLRRLRCAGIRVTCFKGIGVAHRVGVYARPELRLVGDVDVLLGSADLVRAVELAAALGFTTSRRTVLPPHHYQLPLTHPRHGLLELHTDLYRDLPAGTIDTMLARTEPIEVYGAPAEILCDADLWLVCAVHLAQNRDILWIWVVDLYMLGRVMTPAQWRLVEETTLATHTQVFVVAALEAMRAAWDLQPPGMPEAFADRMRAALSLLERLAVARLRKRMPDGPYDGDQLILARRLSGRPVRGERGLWTSIWPHAGVVALATGVSPDGPAFGWERVKFAGRRVGRGVAAVGRLLRGRRR